MLGPFSPHSPPPPSGKEETDMHWYNPKSRVAESVPAPYTDEEAN